MKKYKHGYRDFNFGDIIYFKRRKYFYIELQGEDYFLWDIKKNDSIHVRAYYIDKFTKLRTELVEREVHRFS